jgi:hypothetical protein
VYWHVCALSRSKAALGAIGLVQFLPVVALTLAGRRGRRRLRPAPHHAPRADPYLAGAVLLFVATARGAISVPLLYAAGFVNAITFAFESPRARHSCRASSDRGLPARGHLLVDRDGARVRERPALGGDADRRGRRQGRLRRFGALVLGNLIGLAFVRPVREIGDRTPPSLRAVREGLAYVRRSPIVLGCMALDMFAVIFAGATALLPVYATEILAVGPRGYGLLSSSLEIGALAMALLLLIRPTIRRAGPVLLTAVAVYGLATLGFGLSRSFPLSVALYMIAGAADQVSVVLRSTSCSSPRPTRCAAASRP